MLKSHEYWYLYCAQNFYVLLLSLINIQKRFFFSFQPLHKYWSNFDWLEREFNALSYGKNTIKIQWVFLWDISSLVQRILPYFFPPYFMSHLYDFENSIVSNSISSRHQEWSLVFFVYSSQNKCNFQFKLFFFEWRIKARLFLSFDQVLAYSWSRVWRYDKSMDYKKREIFIKMNWFITSDCNRGSSNQWLSQCCLRQHRDILDCENMILDREK